MKKWRSLRPAAAGLERTLKFLERLAIRARQSQGRLYGTAMGIFGGEPFMEQVMEEQLALLEAAQNPGQVFDRKCVRACPRRGGRMLSFHTELGSDQLDFIHYYGPKAQEPV